VGPFQTFSFLSEQFVMIGAADAIPGQTAPILEIYDLRHPSESEFDVFGPSVLCSLQFPAVHYAHWPGYSRMMIRTDPSSGRSSHHSVPFSTSPTDRLYVIQCDSNSTDVPSLVVFAPLSMFIAQIDALRTGETGRRFMWEEWGEKGARMLHLALSSIWITYVHGMKFATMQNRQIDVYDFNQLSLKRNLSQGESRTKSRLQFSSHVFSNPVYSSLGYRTWSVPVPADIAIGPPLFRPVLLTEDSLIVIDVSEAQRPVMQC
jgi:hypothetical protein